MEYDEELAKGAQEWAEKMAASNEMEHSSGDYGENLAMHGDVEKIKTTACATDMWYEELNDPGYDFKNPGFGMGTGHFTQVVWKGSTKLGCGFANGWVCARYEPPGNYKG